MSRASKGEQGEQGAGEQGEQDAGEQGEQGRRRAGQERQECKTPASSAAAQQGDGVAGHADVRPTCSVRTQDTTASQGAGEHAGYHCDGVAGHAGYHGRATTTAGRAQVDTQTDRPTIPDQDGYQIKTVAGRCAADGGDVADQDGGARGRRRRRANPKLPIADGGGGGGGEALIPC